MCSLLHRWLHSCVPAPRQFAEHVLCCCACAGGGSAERPSAAITDGETGPSPAAACGVNPPLSQVHHRVVRRLDQHEAWGTSRASPSKQGRGADSSSSSKREGQAAGGTGLSMFSPVKKQRVPLFNESSTIKVGATPSKPDAPGERRACLHFSVGLAVATVNPQQDALAGKMLRAAVLCPSCNLLSAACCVLLASCRRPAAAHCPPEAHPT